MSQRDTQEFEELSIGTVDGLQAFLRNAQVQYNAGLEKEALLMERGNYEYGNALHDIYQKVRHATNRLIAVVKAGDSVTQDDAEELQSHYDRLIRIITETKIHTVVPVQEKVVEKEIEKVEVVAVKKRESEKQVTHQAKKETIVAKPESNLVKDRHTDESRNEFSKPKTGALRITTEDTKITSVKHNPNAQSKPTEESPGTIQDRKPDQQKQKKKRKKNISTPPVTDYKQRILSVLDLSQTKYEELKQEFPEPDIVQNLLFEEVREGLEQLEIMSKKSDITKKQLQSVSEVMSHIKYAMDSITEAATEVIEEKEQQVVNVPIVTDNVQKSLHIQSPSKQAVSFVPTSITTKKPTVANRSVPKDLQTLPKPADIYDTESLTEKYLTAPRYRHFITQNYSSLAGFERVLDATITKIESDTIDQIEKWLGDLPASAFSYIKDMEVAEFYIFAKRPYEVVAADLQNENIKYETFAAWRDMTDEMLELVPSGSEMIFGQLLAHWMIELAMQDVE